MFDNMPEQNKDITFVIANDTRVKPLGKEIQKLMKGYVLPNKVCFLNDVKVNNFVKANLGLSESGKEFVDLNTMCLNQNLPYYFMFASSRNEYNKLLMLDDDVLITGDLLKIFENKTPIYPGNGLSTGRGMQEKDIFQEFLKLANVNYDKWISHSLNSGIRLYFLKNEKHKNCYSDLLRQYFENKIFKERFSIWKNTGKGKTYAFFQDQFFENAFAWKIGCHNSNMDKFARTIYSAKHFLKNSEKYMDRILIHYCCGKRKDIFLEFLANEGLINV